MALFTDGPIIATIDLQSYENGILNVAAAEGIDVAGKLALAQDQIANELMMFLLRRLPPQDYQWTLRRSRGVSDVVVTPPLRQWHAHKTLALVYRDAYNNQLNDRYRGKWNEYEQLAKASCRSYFDIGVGLVADPIVKPPMPTLSSVPGPGAAATYYVATAWINQAGEEGSLSEIAQFTTAGGQVVVVTVGHAPANASGWNVYVGHSPDAMSRQNDASIGIKENWVTAVEPVDGQRAGGGQQPNWFLVDHRVMERG